MTEPNTLLPPVEFAPFAVPTTQGEETFGPWKIERVSGGDAYINLAQREAAVPPPATEPDRHARMHELLHKRYGWGTDAKLPPAKTVVRDFFDMLEEIRVDALGKGTGLDTSKRHDMIDFDKASVMLDFSRQKELQAALWALQTWNTRTGLPARFFAKAWDIAGGIESGKPRQALYRAALEMGEGRVSLGQQIAHAQTLAELFTRPDPPRQNPVKDSYVQQQQAWVQAQAGQTSDVSKMRITEVRLPPPPGGWKVTPGTGSPQEQAAAAGSRAGKQTGEGSVQTAPEGEMLGKMFICRHVGVAKMSQKANRAPSGVQTFGLEPTRFERRREGSGAIYPKRRAGGIVLVDGSGSMVWDLERLQASLRDVPAMTLAVYSGSRGPGQAQGILCVLAERGRVADPRQRNLPSKATPKEVKRHLQGVTYAYEESSEVDLEALVWASRQRGPRVWLSDGKISIKAYGSTRPEDYNVYARKCEQVARKGKIFRAMDTQSVINFLRKGGRYSDDWIIRPDAGVVNRWWEA